jgi:signal transduction histidine kinase
VAPWIERSTLHVTKLRQVIRAVTDGVAADLGSLRSERSQQMWRDTGLLILALIGAMLLAAAIGRGFATDLRRLRDQMRKVADHLPRLISSVSEDPLVRGAPGGHFPTTPPERPDDPIGVAAAGAASSDEIAQVGQAFEEVRHQAIRLAAAQATRRLSVAGVAQTLTGRTQDLVSRQLELITELESAETDPDNLTRLFQLDHLATRIRRHGDNLLVLSGGSPAWRWPHPATLEEIVKAATAATEQYRRVEVYPLISATVPGETVVVLVQILAELIDNATRFSDPDTTVRVRNDRLPDGDIRIEVRNTGHGVGRRTAARLNARLVGPAVEDQGDEPTLGLYVVAALAARIGVHVELMPVERGCVATLNVPADLLSEPPPHSATADDVDDLQFGPDPGPEHRHESPLAAR